MIRHHHPGGQHIDPTCPRPAPANSMRIQFHAPVAYANIRGPYHISIGLEAPAVVWGRDGRCWAFLHDFDPRSVDQILSQYRGAAHQRRSQWGAPFTER
jgi:hypothetical protein